MALISNVASQHVRYFYTDKSSFTKSCIISAFHTCPLHGATTVHMFSRDPKIIPKR